MNVRTLPYLLFVLALSSFTAKAQLSAYQPPPMSDIMYTEIGISAGLGAAVHTGTFLLPDAPTCCTGFGEAIGLGPAVGVFFRQEVAKRVRLALRFGMQPMGASFTTEEQLLLTDEVAGRSTHELNVGMTALRGELLADVRVADEVRLMAGLGMSMINSATYSQREVLSEPSTGTFSNGRRVRGERTEAPLTVKTQIVAVVGVGYDIPLTANRSIVVTPEALYAIPVGPVIDGLDWHVASLRVGASLAFAFNAPRPQLPVLYQDTSIVDSIVLAVMPDDRYRRTEGAMVVTNDTVATDEAIIVSERRYQVDTVFVPERPVIVPTIVVRSAEGPDTDDPSFGLRVSTQFVTEALPLLPIVFFDPSGVSLSFRYHQLKGGEAFSEDAIPPTTTAVHREVLNVVGARMQKDPTARLRLRGYADPTTEGSSCDLARRRAEAVRDYLVRVWELAPERFDLVVGSSSCAPPRVIRQQSEAGYSEHRRVDMETDNFEILASVRRRRFGEARAIAPARIRIEPKATPERYVTSWSVTARNADTAIIEREGRGAPTSFVHEISTTTADQLRADRPLSVDLVVQGLQGVTERAEVAVRVAKDTQAVEVERLTLTLFDVSSDQVGERASAQIRDFVEKIPAGSTIHVRGYADMLGNAEFNKRISQRRAEAVCETIRRSLRVRAALECNDIATDRFPPGIASYDTPEERFLSRTVQIEVRRPQ